jgi:serine/threonine protein phosphatase PrpC
LLWSCCSLSCVARSLQALYRINRDISLSRAIGDRDLKRFGVIGTPDVTVHRCETAATGGRGAGGLLCLVVATDGVWDVLRPGACARMLQQVVDDAEAQHHDNHHGGAGGDAAAEAGTSVTAPFTNVAQAAVERLVSAARGVEKNNDDVTAIVVTLWQRP